MTLPQTAPAPPAPPASPAPPVDTGSHQPALQPGSVIDRFQLVDRLHVGGMAQIWQVIEVDHAGDSRLPLVMKVPRIKGGEDPATIVGFEVEQMIMPMLSGPHVPKFIAKGDFTRQPYIVMERIEGDSLRPRMDEAPLALDEDLSALTFHRVPYDHDSAGAKIRAADLPQRLATRLEDGH